MQELLPLANKIAAILKQRRETIAVAESSTGGLISAALLGVPGASAYFIAGAVVYTLKAREMLQIQKEAFAGIRSVTEAGATIYARAARERFSVTWSIAEIGASGPTGNRYGDPPGHSCIAVAGPVERSTTIETASGDRVGNMRAFAAAALNLFAEALASSGRPA